MATFKKQLYVPNKREYITGVKRPKVDCILCSIIEKDQKVENLTIWQNDIVATSVNLYPYNVGHLLLFPIRHMNDPRQLSSEENRQMNALLIAAMNRLDSIYSPAGYNIGYNIGEASGASISHLHQHLVPRYSRELGFVDITSGAKIIIEDPNITVEKLKNVFSDLSI